MQLVEAVADERGGQQPKVATAGKGSPSSPPAEHWVQLRTTNAVESLFATVRSKGDTCRTAQP